MNIAFDLHGVLTANSIKYKAEMKILCKTEGTKVFIVSGPKAKDIEKELFFLGFYKNIHYHEIASVIDFLLSQANVPRIDQQGNYWFEEKTWWESKSLICKELEIDILTDDHIEYGAFFVNGHPTKFILEHHAKNN
jgi:hypothetical protein